MSPPGYAEGAMEERPAPSPQKLRTQFKDWESGDELPGRTLAYLKTGFLPEVLAELDSTEALGEIQQAWEQWERGITEPEEVLDVLKTQGLGAILAELAS